MKLEERVKMIKAMEFICRHINNDNIFMEWLMTGVADGDIEYGDFSVDNLAEDEATYYAEDDGTFRELMECFLRRMKFAKEDGGLYCDGVVGE